MSRESLQVLLLLRILLGLLTIALLLVMAGIIANRPPLTQPPELRPREYPLPPQQLYAVARATLAELGWPLLAEDMSSLYLHAVVTTRLWKFKDDFELTMEPLGGGSRLQLVSQSRVGRGDLGANTRHILDFSAALERRLAALNPRR